jgi:UDP-3-O-[3-hydroxymyristoyl] glucosamine N-acyltransferase
MGVMVYKGAMQLKKVAELIHARLIGNGDVEIEGVSSIESASAGDLIFVEGNENLPRALKSPASAVLVGDFGATDTSKPLLVSTQPRLAFARAARHLGPTSDHRYAIHPSAAVHPSARLAKEVQVDERVVIGEGVEIGSGTSIGAGSVIGANVVVGNDCELHPNVTIYPGTRLGNRVVIQAGAVLGSDGFGYVRDKETGRYEKFPQIGRLEIEDDVEVGANSTIDRGALDVTRIGRGTKIDNLVHVGHNVQIGEDVVVAAQTGLSGSAVVQKNVVIGGQVGIADHVRIEEGAILGAQSGIPSNKIIRGKGIVFWGTPARPIREYLKELAVLARLAKRE